MADDDLDLEGMDPEETGNPDLFKRLRSEIRKRDERIGALEPAQRELAFRSADVDVNSDLGKLFIKGYDGKLDSESIKAAWEPFAPKTTPPPEGQPSPTGQDGTQTDAAADDATPPPPSGSADRRAITDGGQAPAGAMTGDFVENAQKDAFDLIKKGASVQQAGGNLLNRMVNGVASGELSRTLDSNGRRLSDRA